LAASVFRLTLHPFVRSVLVQLANPVLQELTHTAPAQAALSFVVEQACPQPPQLPGSVLGSTHVLPEHTTLGAMQAEAAAQTPLLQKPLRQFVFSLHICPF